jgi:hypothetical protein
LLAGQTKEVEINGGKRREAKDQPSLTIGMGQKQENETRRVLDRFIVVILIEGIGGQGL